jgi:hypothetical protein
MISDSFSVIVRRQKSPRESSPAPFVGGFERDSPAWLREPWR